MADVNPLPAHTDGGAGTYRALFEDGLEASGLGQ